MTDAKWGKATLTEQVEALPTTNAGITISKAQVLSLARGRITVPATGTYLVIDGKPLPVIGMWPERATTSDGRARWGVVTQEEPPADDNSTGGQPLAGNNTITDHYAEGHR